MQKKLATNLKTNPPEIRLVTEPTELVILDGKPELRPLEGSSCMKVINTMYLVVLEPDSKHYFLNLGSTWMTAAATCWATQGIIEAMNQFNHKKIA